MKDERKEEMLIENRIKKRNETDSCNWEKLVIENYKGFSVQKKWEQFRRLQEESWGGQNNVRTKDYGLFTSYNPKNTIICEAQAKSWICFKFLWYRMEKSKTAVQAKKSVRWMPWHWEPMKDVITCDKPWLGGNSPWPMDFRMGKPLWRRAINP